MNIVKTVGGPNEKIRSKELLNRIIVLPDNATTTKSTLFNEVNNSEHQLLKNVQFTSHKRLPLGGKVKERSLIIFTFGDRIGAVTVTANDGFVRAAKQQVFVLNNNCT